MKCVKKKNDIRRVTDKIALELVRNDGFSYIPKSEWKEKVRDKVEEKEVKKPKQSKKKKSG